MVPPQLRVPELVPNIDIRALPLTSVDGFVLSRIDGRTSVIEIVALTGLAPEMVSQILDRLSALGVVCWAEPASRPSSRTPSSRPRHAQSEHPFARPAEPSPRSDAGSDSDRPTGLHAAPSTPPASDRAASRSAPPHRRTSVRPQPRRLMSEAGYSTPPPELRTPGRESSTPAALRGGSITGRPRAPTPTPEAHPQAKHPVAIERVRTSTPSPRAPKAEPQAQAPRAPRAAGPASQVHAEVRGPAPFTPQASMPPMASMPPAARSEPPRSVPASQGAYDPRELEEEGDLPRDRRKQVLDLYYRLEHLDYYEALGVGYQAQKSEIRAAYFALSKVFHPDSMFRKNLGSFKPKMEAVFQYLTEGYETLGKKKSREEYDAYLRATKATQMAERTLQRELEASIVGPSIRVPPAPAVPVVTSSLPPPEPSPAAHASMAPPRDVSPEARRLAQEVVARRLRGVTQAQRAQRPAEPPPPPAVPSPDVPPQARTDPQELLRRLTRTLKDVAQFTGTNDAVTRSVKASQAAFARGDLTEAAQQLSRAISLAPERGDLRVEFERISKLTSEKLASDYEQQALFQQKSGKWASAALAWAKVCEGRSQDAHAHRAAAHALLKAGGDLRGAQKYAQQAAFLAPNDIDSRILLAQIYLTIGLKLNARRELDAAAKLDPKNEIVKNLLADLKT